MNNTDPTGMVIDTVADVLFTLYDVGALIYDEVATGGENRTENLLASGADAAAIFVPFATGGGLAVRGTVKAVDKVADVTKAADHAGDAAKVNLASPERTQHILHGDKTGGGHLSGTGKPGKSEFPSSMSGDDIMHEASDIATMPNPSGGRQTQRNGRTVTKHTSNGVDIKVVDDGKDIITAYPENVPRNP